MLIRLRVAGVAGRVDLAVREALDAQADLATRGRGALGVLAGREGLAGWENPGVGPAVWEAQGVGLGARVNRAVAQPMLVGLTVLGAAQVEWEALEELVAQAGGRVGLEELVALVVSAGGQVELEELVALAEGQVAWEVLEELVVSAGLVKRDLFLGK